MVKFDFSNLSKIPVRHGVSAAEQVKYSRKISSYLKASQSRDQDFLKLLSDRKLLEQLRNFAKRVEGKYTDIVVLGIGGSALGAAALEQALAPRCLEERAGIQGQVHLTVLDNIDPLMLVNLEFQLNLKKTLFLVISKSGGTVEIAAQFAYFRSKVEACKLDWRKHFVLVTGAKGFLRDLAAKNPQVPVFDIPEKVGGRFSALTVVGLLPAALCGINIDELLRGARIGRSLAEHKKLSQNSAFQLALSQYLLYRKGKKLTVFYHYAQRLTKLAEWYRQLLAESIGKKVDRQGRTVNIGITPVTAVGVTDQHSQNQLYQEGPNDKFYLFLDVQKSPCDRRIPVTSMLKEGGFSYLQGQTFQSLLRAEMAGTIQALVKAQRPLVNVSIPTLSPQTLGEIMVILEASVAYLAELLDINAYDQPGVELSKKLTRVML